MRGMADDWEVGGPIRLICRGYEKAPRAAVIGTHIEEMDAALAVPRGRSICCVARRPV